MVTIKQNIVFCGSRCIRFDILLHAIFMNLPVNGNFDGGIQNKLVWSVKGECFFVRPLNQTDTLLVRVKDCDKSEVIQKVGK
jgi:hypothetical protein